MSAVCTSEVVATSVGAIRSGGGWRADPGQPGPRPQPPAGQAAQAGAEPDRELLDVVHEQAALPAGAGGGEQPVAPEIRPVGGRPGQVRLQLGPAQPGVGDDAVEVVHQRRLGQRRQLRERYLAAGGVGAEQVPVVGRGGHGVGDQGPQPLALEGEQPVA
jgi:hypothetical protein